MASNNPLANLLGAGGGGGYGGSLLGQAGTATTITTPYNQPLGSAVWTTATGYNPSPFPMNSIATVGSFRVQKIANGYLVDLVKFHGGQVETHHVDDYKQAGELIIATLVRWELEGNK